MKNLNEYLNNEIERVKPLDESTVSIGKTDTYGGSKVCGPHHHDYILWDPSTGWGKTGPALDDPKKGMMYASCHEHMIVDGKVLEAAGHTHDLEAPVFTGDQTKFAPQAAQTKEVK
jgi:hypothetical protein